MLRAACLLLIAVALHENAKVLGYEYETRGAEGQDLGWGCYNGFCYTYCSPFLYGGKCGAQGTCRSSVNKFFGRKIESCERDSDCNRDWYCFGLCDCTVVRIDN